MFGRKGKNGDDYGRELMKKWERDTSERLKKERETLRKPDRIDIKQRERYVRYLNR